MNAPPPGPSRAPLAAGRWHFQHGPIDLLIEAHGRPDAVQRGHVDAWARFQDILQELVDELPALRQPICEHCPVTGVVAVRMWQACHPHRRPFITAMAAVAGSVAQELLRCYQRDGVERAWVNNGGDIALHLSPGSRVTVGVCSDLRRFDPAVGRVDCELRFELAASLPVRGVATSGWRGRSLSLGIADSVTVLAADAAQADAAATVIANAVNVADDRIQRARADSLRDDSDLGALEATIDVPALPPEQVRRALERGAQCARTLRQRGLIHGAVLVCQRQLAQVLPDADTARLTRTPAPAPHGSVFAYPARSVGGPGQHRDAAARSDP